MINQVQCENAIHCKMKSCRHYYPHKEHILSHNLFEIKTCRLLATCLLIYPYKEWKCIRVMKDIRTTLPKNPDPIVYLYDK
jgi:mRNA-degrading endonuclease YafQ of YafQ-DinJ toxin-antitoxin module